MRSISIRQLLTTAGITEERIPAVMLKLPPINPSGLRTDPGYLADLVTRTQRQPEEIAGMIGIPESELGAHLAGTLAWPYSVQYGIEVLAVVAEHLAHHPS